MVWIFSRRSGALHVARTNAFLWGGKALINAYYRSAQELGIEILYNTKIKDLKLNQGYFEAAIAEDGRVFKAKSCVLAAGGFESNLEWLREAWGQNENGEWPADNFIIRGTRFNQGNLLKFMIDQGADIIGDPSQSHCVAVDARAPLYDGGICTRIDCVSLGIVVNNKAERFTMKAKTSGQNVMRFGPSCCQTATANCLFDYRLKSHWSLYAPVFAGVKANSIQELAEKSGWMQNLIPYRRRI